MSIKYVLTTYLQSNVKTTLLHYHRMKPNLEFVKTNISSNGINHKTLPHFHFNENIISFQGGISKLYIRHFAWANGRVAVGGVLGGRLRVERRHPATPRPHAGSIRHLSWSPWRPRTERGGAAAWMVGAHGRGTPRSPRARAKWKNRYSLIWDKSLYKNTPVKRWCGLRMNC